MLSPLRQTALLTGALLAGQLCPDARAQLDAGLVVGATAYDGELTPADLAGRFEEARLALGAFGRYQFSPMAAARLGYTYLSIEGSDVTRPTSVGRNHRFVTDIHEVAASLEFYVLGTDRRLAPYLTAGVGAFYYNPTTDYNPAADPSPTFAGEGLRFDLRPLGTEGQGNPGFGDLYSEWAFAVPLGGGLRFRVTPAFMIGAEVVGRFTAVDHLDDISREFYVPLEELTLLNGPLSAELSYRPDEINAALRPDDMTRRANPETNDYYLTAQITASFRFGQGDALRNGVRKSSKPLDCPKF